MVQRYSVAEARDRFAELLHSLKRTSHIEVTRRGRPVAVLLSVEEYERLQGRGTGFWDAYTAFCEAFPIAELGIERELADDLRDRSSGRTVSL